MSRRACLILLGLMAIRPASAPGGPVTADDVRRSIDKHWQSIDLFLMESDEFVPGKNGERKPGSGLMHYEFASGKGGQKRLRIMNNLPGGTEHLIEDIREDGRHRYISLVSRAGETSRIQTQPQHSVGHAWDGTMSAALWLVLPAGMTLAQHLEAGAKLDVMPDGETATITFTHRRFEVVCELSGSHDWLARSVTLKTMPVPIRFVVERFSRVDGRWYPSSGHFTAVGPAGPHPTPYRFDVTKFRYKLRPNPRLFDFQDEAESTAK